ncbi:unnamed protein product [Discosporangium mesarthrocarpum]
MTHVQWERASISEGVHYMGREGFATVAYQVTIDQTGYARGVTFEFPRARNDKAIMQYNDAIRNTRLDPKYTQLEYKLVGSEGNGYTEKGTYMIANGGYHKVKTLHDFVCRTCTAAVVLGCCKYFLVWVM